MAAALLPVLYAPADYLHETRRHALPGLDALPRSLAHAQVRIAYRLGTAFAADVTLDPLAQRCVHDWRRLPRVFALVGVRLMHGALLAEPLLRGLDAHARAFLRLPLPVASASVASAAQRWLSTHALPADGDTHREALPDGLAGLGLSAVAPLLGGWPAPLRERLPLLFPPGIAARAGFPEVVATALQDRRDESDVRDTGDAAFSSSLISPPESAPDACPSAAFTPDLPSATIRNWLTFAFVHARLA